MWWLGTQLQDLRDLAEQSPLLEVMVGGELLAPADQRVASCLS